MGFLPILDIVYTPFLPHKGENFTADMSSAGCLVGHDAFRGGDDCGAQALHDLGHILAVGVNAQARLRNALQAGDECALYLSFTAEYDSDEAFAADCQAVLQAADANGLGFTTYHFSSCDDLQEGTRYTLDCNAAFPVGLTAAQLAGRVEKEYYYDGSAFSTEADRDSYIRAQLENEIEQEYEATHDGESMTKEYLDSEVARSFAALYGTATPETAAA